MIDLTADFEDWQPPAVAVVNERTRHSDRYMERVLSDLPWFLRHYFNFPNDHSNPQHVYNALRTMFRGGRLCYQWSTDHAKSITGQYFYPLASLAADPESAHILMGANELDAKRRLQMLQRALETGQAGLEGEAEGNLLTDFPWLKKPKRAKDTGGGLTWSRKELTIDGRTQNNPNPSVYACTTGSADVRGRRAKLVMDDIEGEDARKSAAARRDLYNFVKLEAVTCLEDQGSIARPLVCAMGTPFDIDSVYIKLEDEGWETIKIPAYTVPYPKVEQYAYMKLADGTQSNTKTPWEERAARLPSKLFTWPRKRYKVCEHDPNFGAQMTKQHFLLRDQCDPTAGDHNRLNFKTLRRLVEDAEFDDQGAWITVVSLDPAAGVGEDYAGISVVKIRWPQAALLPDIQVLEAHRFTDGITEQVDFVADLCWKYPETQDGAYKGRPLRVVYENNAQQGGQYKNVFSHRRPEIRLVPIYTSGAAKADTELGLTVIKTLVKQHKLGVPASQADSDGVQTLLREIRDLGSNADDHISCSIWFVVRWIFGQVRMLNAPKLEDHNQSRRFSPRQPGFFRRQARATWHRR